MTTSAPYLIPDLVPGQFHRDEEVIRGSRFIVTMAHTPSIDAAKAFIAQISEEHCHATHNCWAFQASRPTTTGWIGCSDDGEPKGTAGRPMLNVLVHSPVGEVSAVVTRYFGGTLLGTGGLVRAYQGLVKLGLEGLPTREKRPSATYQLTIEHRFAHHATVLIEKARGRMLAKSFETDVTLTFEVELTEEKALLAALQTATNGQLLLQAIES